MAGDVTEVSDQIGQAGVPVPDDSAPEPGTPEWWADFSEAELNKRAPLVQLYDDYYAGKHKLAFATAPFREAFAGMLAAVSDNWIPLIVQATVERLKVQGFRFGDSSEDDEQAWEIWQENNLDADAALLFTEAIKHGEAYLLVEAEVTRGFFAKIFRRPPKTTVRITVEHPSQMIVHRSAGDRRVIDAAFKMWQEPTGEAFGTLWLPDNTYKFRKTDKGWKSRTRGDKPLDNPTGVVPVIPVVNDPQLNPAPMPTALSSQPHNVPEAAVGLGRSDVGDVVPTVDQINKLLCDMMIASEIAAYRQRWATGLEAEVDEEGNEVQQFRPAVDRMWVVGPDEDGNNNVKFGEFEASDLSNYHGAIETRVHSMAARTRTPPHYLLGQITNTSGEALTAAETGLASKVRGKSLHFGEALERAMRLAFAWKGDKRAEDVNAETIWGPMETRSEAEHVDALVKLLALNVPVEELWREKGYTPQQIRRFKTMLLEQAALGDLFAPEPAVEPAPAAVE